MERRVVRKPVVNTKSIKSVLNSLKNSELLAYDSETSGFDFILNKLHTLQFCNDGEKAYFIKFEDIKKYGYQSLVKEVLDSAKRVCTSNGKFDARFLWTNGIEYDYKNLWATDLMSHALNSNIDKGLKKLSLRYTSVGGYDQKLDEVRKKLKVENYTQIPIDILKDYSGMDVVACWRVFKALEENIYYVDSKFPNEKQPDWTIWRYIEEIMNPNYHIIIQTELRGVWVSIDKLHEARSNLQNKASELRQAIANEINGEIQANGLKVKPITPDFEFTSSQKLGKLLESIEWPCIERSADGTYSTGDPALEAWRLIYGKKAAPLISDLRSYLVGIKTFTGSTDDLNSPEITGWAKYIRYHSEDDSYRMHPNCIVQAAESFRHRMTAPNLQQIPTKGDLGKWTKNCIVVPPNVIYSKITDNNGKEWTTQYTEYFNTKRGKVFYKDLLENDEILSYNYETKKMDKFGIFPKINQDHR